MLYHGIGLDLISLSKMPLHSVPLFQFSSPDPAAADSIQPEEWDNLTALDNVSVAGQDEGISGNGTGQRKPANGGGGPIPPNSSKLDSLFSVHAPSSLHSANSPAARSSLSSRHPQLRHRPSMSSLRDVDRAPPSSPLRESHHPLSVQQQRALPSTPQSILKPVSIYTSSGVGTIARGVAVPDDQRDPLYYDPLPTLKSHVAQHSRAPSASTAPFPASSTHASMIPSSPTPLPLEPPTQLPNSLYYSEPLFVFPHFFGTQPDKPHRVDRFMPRARCYELFSQGLGERISIALPLLKHDSAFASITTNENEDEEGRGYLDEMEKKLKRREMFDAAALGVQDLDTAWDETAGANGGGIIIGRKGNWGVGRQVGSGGELGGGRDSGVSEGVSTGGSYGGTTSESASASAGERVGNEEDESSQSSAGEQSDDPRGSSRRGNRSLIRKESESEGDENGFGIGMPSVMVAAAKSEARQSRQHRTGSVSTTASSNHGEPERGRQSSRKGPTPHENPLPSNDSGGRSRTPVPKVRRQERSSSIAASVRTATSMRSRGDGGSNHGTLHNPSNRKASTPALIARLTGGPPPPRSTSSNNSSPVLESSPLPPITSPPKQNIALPRPSWLSLFSRTNSSSSATTITPANVGPLPSTAQVAVARVDVQANINTEAGTSPSKSNATGSPVLSATSISQRRGSASIEQIEAEDAVAASTSSNQQPTQPITIGSRGTPSRAKEDGRGKQNEGGQATSLKRDKAAAPGQISGSLKAYEPGEAMRKGLGKGGGRISVAARFNPSKPGKRSVGLADQARRWAGILVIERKNMRLGVKWR